MSEIKKKRELIDVLNRVIPSMDEMELNALAVTLLGILKHMEERGTIEEEKSND